MTLRFINNGSKNMKKRTRTDTSVAINEERNIRLQKAAVDITIARQEVFKMSEIVQFLIDEYLEDAVKDLKNKR